MALTVFGIAFLTILFTSDVSTERETGRGATAEDGSRRSARAEGARSPGDSRRIQSRFYTVETGDTLAEIGEKTGVSVEELLELNPELDPQALVSGQKIRLRQ